MKRSNFSISVVQKNNCVTKTDGSVHGVRENLVKFAGQISHDKGGVAFEQDLRIIMS
jgi:hypothetical protein